MTAENRPCLRNGRHGFKRWRGEGMPIADAGTGVAYPDHEGTRNGLGKSGI